MIKKLLAIMLSITLIFSLCSFAFAEEEYIPGEDEFNEEEYNPLEDYEFFDNEGNYEPMETYFCGQLVGLNESIDIREINQVTLTLGDVSHNVDVDSEGKFSLMLPDSEGYMAASIPNEKFYILPDQPIDNNKVFVSLSGESYKTIYVGIRSNITGTVTDAQGTAKVAGAAVTCYYRANEDAEWSLWMGNEFSSNANRTTDANGVFSYAVTSGQYRFVVKADGYANYDSSTVEYMSGIAPTGETTSVTLHLTPDKQMSLISVTPEQGGILDPDGVIKLVFSQPVAKNSVSDYDNLRLDRVSTRNYVPFTATTNGNEVTLKPTSRLIEGQKYNIIITPNIKAADGASLNINRVVTFTCQEDSQVQTPVEENPAYENKVGLSNDISGHWSKMYMEKLINLGIIDGAQANGITCYYPDKELTRAEFAKYIVMSQGIETAKASTGTFADGDSIPFDLRPYVYGAYNAGLIQGSKERDGQLCFLPDDTITRAEIITILGRFMGDTSNAPLTFADAAEVPKWAMPYVASCVEKGYVQGYNKAGVMYIQPLDNVTRAEAATIISKMLDNEMN